MREACNDGYGLQPQLILVCPGMVLVKRDAIAVDLSALPLPAGFQ